MMNFRNKIITGLFLCIFLTVLSACQKDDSEKPYGFTKIYMPQAVVKSGGLDANYPVPSGQDTSNYNYTINKTTNKVNVILGALLAGPESGAYSVGITVNNDTVQQMLTSGILDRNVYQLMPASMYTVPTSLEVPAGMKGGTFNLAVDIAQLKSASYVGKFLVVAVKISNPSQYQLNSSLSTTIIIVDVNSLVIGPRVDITSQFILNAGNPFIASAMNGARWGTLKDWKSNDAVISHGGVGGFGSDGDGKNIDLESGWGSPQILNGKLYQTITLPAGTYAFDLSGGTWKWQGLKDIGYAVVAPKLDTLPDYSNIATNAAIMYQKIAQPQALVNFELTATTKVTIGTVVNYIQTEQGIKTTKVSLYNYPKHL